MKETKNFFSNNNRLNKGYTKVNNLKESDRSFYRKQFEHVLPPIDVMAEYENIYPGALAKLIDMAEKEQLHRHQLELKNIEAYKSLTQKGRISAVIFVLIVCITTIILAMVGDLMLASIFAVSAFLIIGIGTFWTPMRFSKKNYNKKTDH